MEIQGLPPSNNGQPERKLLTPSTQPVERNLAKPKIEPPEPPQVLNTNGQSPVKGAAIEPIEVKNLAINLPPPNSYRYRVDESINRVVVSVINGETGNVEKQIPPEELIAAIRRISNYVDNFIDEIA